MHPCLTVFLNNYYSVFVSFVSAASVQAGSTQRSLEIQRTIARRIIPGVLRHTQANSGVPVDLTTAHRSGDSELHSSDDLLPAYWIAGHVMSLRWPPDRVRSWSYKIWLKLRQWSQKVDLTIYRRSANMMTHRGDPGRFSFTEIRGPWRCHFEQQTCHWEHDGVLNYCTILHDYFDILVNETLSSDNALVELRSSLKLSFLCV